VTWLRWNGKARPDSRWRGQHLHRRSARIGALIASFSLVATLSTALGATPAHAADTGGVLKIAMSAGNVPIPDTYCDQGAEGTRFVCNNIYDQLVHYNLDQDKTLPTPHPDLATHWTVSPNHLTWTFYLRHGVSFTDGTPFNAAAVIFNWERDSNPKFKYYDSLDGARLATTTAYWKSFKAVNNYEVQLTTTVPYSFELWDQTTVFYGSPTAIKKWGNANYPQHAVGTGPFVMTKYVNNVTMVLKPNEHYWAGPPKLDEIQLFPEPEDASRLASLESGAVNWAEVPSPDALSELKGQGYQIFMDDHHPGAIMPLMNEYRPPLNNLKVREALNYAINRNATVAVINGTGLPASQYVAPGNPYYVPDDPGYYYDPAKAKELLAEAGYGPKHTLNLQMAYPPNGSGNMFPEPMMEELQSNFKAVGVNLSITPIEWDTFLTISTTGGLAAPQWSKYDIIWGSPTAGMTPTGYKTTFLCNVGSVKNEVGYCDPKNTTLWDNATSSFNVAQQDKDVQGIERNAMNDSAILYWVIDRNLRVMSPDVHGYIQAQSWYVDFTKIWVS
jgi:peptide/nickel transport system substrate-binding protein